MQAIFNEVPMCTAIDVGAGTGRHAIVLARRGVAVTAVDPSPAMMAVARDKAARAGLEIDFRIGSLDDRLPADDDQFDFLVCALTLSHIPDIEHAVRECARVVRTGGSILISAIHPDVANGLGWTARAQKPGRDVQSAVRGSHPLGLSQFDNRGPVVRSRALRKFLLETRQSGL